MLRRLRTFIEKYLLPEEIAMALLFGFVLTLLAVLPALAYLIIRIEPC
jgi:hypothetical protein